MAGRGGDVQASGSGPDRPGPTEAPGRAGADAVPAETLRSWDAAEARLFPLVMARPEEYERSLALIQVLLGWLRSRCQDVPGLLAQSARGAAIVTAAADALSAERAIRDPLDRAGRDAERGPAPRRGNARPGQRQARGWRRDRQLRQRERVR